MHGERWYSEPPSDILVGKYYGGVMMDKEKLLFEMMEDLEDYLKDGCWHCNEDKHEKFNDYEEKVKEVFGFDFEEEQHKRFRKQVEEHEKKIMKLEVPRPIR